MCVVSVVTDYAGQRWDKQFQGWQGWVDTSPPITRAEFAALKAEVQELRDLLKASIKFDEATGQPHCEADDKVAKLRKMAEIVGVDMDDVLGRMKDEG